MERAVPPSFRQSSLLLKRMHRIRRQPSAQPYHAASSAEELSQRTQITTDRFLHATHCQYMPHRDSSNRYNSFRQRLPSLRIYEPALII
ncbi:hypothetical protein TNCV_935991 [Trichonephila clavipes]|nr:hypothetical protein TNCV_935991 [Trichonephila clavipes]